MYDIAVIGGGPAALSAAVTARARGKNVAVVSTDRAYSGLWKAQEVPNYPGFPSVSGAELLNKMAEHALAAGAELITGRVSSVIPGDTFFVSYDQDFLQAKSLILATGIVQTGVFPGEAEFLGRGVSYCATCDGMLYRGKKVCVVCLAPDAEDEADQLQRIGCDVTKVFTGKVTVNGTDAVESITADGEEIPCDGVFILRRSIAPASLVPGIELEAGHVGTDRAMRTNIPGIFAAGDCTGTPYQISKAVGEGLVAALSAVAFIDGK